MKPSDEITNYAKFRMLTACLFGVNVAAVLNELGISRTLLNALYSETALPDAELQGRILQMSRRWPHGLIALADWPEPMPDRRGGKRIAAR